MLTHVYNRLRFWSGTSFRFWPWAMGLTGVVLLGAFYFFLAAGGPRRAGTEESGVTRKPMNAEQLRLSDHVGELERSYQRMLTAGVTGPDAISTLEQAIELERGLLKLNALAGIEQNVRLERLTTARDNERARMAAARVASLQQAAEEERKAGHPDAALDQLRTALQAQREADNSNAEGRFKNFVREMELAQAVDTAEAAPIHDEAVTALQQARAAVADRRWADALAAYTRARDAQRVLNQKYGRTPFADLTALDGIESEIASLNAAGSAAEIDAREQAADTAADQGRVQEAAGLYRAAADLQRDLNERFARSRFVSTQRLEQLEVKRQTALAAEMLRAAADLDRGASSALAKRQVLAADEKIAHASELLELVEKDYPKTLNYDGALKIKLAFLGVRCTELRQLQDATYDHLAPVPDLKNLLMLKTEVPQDLYAKIMSTNPSRNTGRDLPVDSVSWNDAQEFCQRLGWVLGARVRLPTADEYRAALGDADGAIWSAENAGGHSQPTGLQTANAAGFFDLAGNLAEWVEADAASGTKAAVLGGSYLDGAATLRTLVSVLVAKNERARHVGFRFVVEFPID